MNVYLKGKHRVTGSAIYITIGLTETQETIEILEKLGYTIVYKEPILQGRFKELKTKCLTTLRRMIQKN